MIRIKKYQVHFISFALILIYSFLPLIINGFDKPPADDARRLEELGFEFKRYLGHIPGLLIPMYWYFLLTPALVYIGLAVLIGKSAPLAWLVLMLLSGAILNHMHNGSHIPIINFYLFGLIAINFAAKKKFLYLTLILLPMPIFHTSSAVFIMVGLIIYGAFRPKPKILLATLPAWIALFIWNHEIGTTLNRVLHLSLGITEAMHYKTFIQIYFGPPLILITCAVVAIVFLSRKNINFDPRLQIIAATIWPLLVVIFVPLNLDPPRAANAFIGLLSIGGVILFSYLSFRPKMIVGAILLVLFIAIGPYSVGLWLDAGAYSDEKWLDNCSKRPLPNICGGE